jgi:hypothetical protein
MTGHVFVSHGSDDSQEANALAALIESKGVVAWIAPRDVRPGQDYSEQLQAAIENCAAFVVLVSDKANKSPFVRAETEMAFSTSKPIYPVRMSDVQPAAGLAFFLKLRHWTDAFGPEREANMARLVRELEAFAGTRFDPAPAPPAPSLVPPPPPTPAVAPAFVAAAMSAPAAAATRQPLPDDTSLIEAAVGTNQAYFLDHWRRMDDRNKSWDWNWPACLFNVFWFAFRKMWWPAVLLGIVWLVASVMMADPSNKAMFKLGAIVLIAPSFITGGFGNRWYRSHVERLVAATAGVDRDRARAELAAKGGVSALALIISIVAMLFLSLLATLPVAVERAVRQQQMQDQANLVGPIGDDGGAGAKPPPDTTDQETPPSY